MDAIVIVSMGRTPIGNLLGELKDFSATQLGSAVISAVVERAKLNPVDIQEVIMGCVLPAGLGQAPARQAAIRAGLSDSTPCTTINKVCGSGMKALMLAHDILTVGSANIIIAGGMESMTNAPYLLPKARLGFRLGHTECFDHLILDGLQDAYEGNQSMGFFAESCASQFGLTRQAQDDFARESFKRAIDAIDHHYFSHEIVALTQQTKQGEKIIDIDERPKSVDLNKMPALKPAFAKDGTVTAGNASSIADGAAALCLMKLSSAEKRGLTPIARVAGQASFANAPSRFTTAPIDAIKKLLAQLNWSIHQVDLFEINEAFAVVVLAAMQSLNIPHDKINIHGGACALGHPIGASGARIIVTLLSALQQKKLKRGIACLCIGGGEATAVAFELCE
jgi:acetyl-CoA C-acetyltransferase